MKGSSELPGLSRRDADGGLGRYVPLLAATAAGALITVVTVATPSIHLAYQNPPLHVALETAEALIASIVGLVLFGRFRETRRERDLALVFALVLLALTNIVFSVIPTIVLQGRPDASYAWAPATLRLLAAGALVVSAFGLGDRITRVRQPAAVVTALAVLTVLVAGAAVLLLAPHLPVPVNDMLLSRVADTALFQGHPAFRLLQGANMLLLGIASYGFGRLAANEDETSMHWIAAACVFAAYARLHYILFPSLYTEYVYTGDFLRLAFYVVLLVGGVREIMSFWEGRAASAVAGERQRFARDLHDGAAQELLFILAQTRRLLKGKGDREDLESLASSADRAVYESRRAINALSSTAGQRLDDAIREAAEELGRRWGRQVELDLEMIAIDPEPTEHLVRVAREAMTNAVKHASPSFIKVRLTSNDLDAGPEVIVLVVEDDGAGFEVDEVRSRKRFGLTSMQERVTVLGGTITYTSRPGVGTTVRVVFPLSSAEEPTGERPV